MRAQNSRACARKLPELARSLGRSLQEFKKGREDTDKPEPPKAPGEEKK